MIPHGEAKVNRLQRQLREISDERLDDTAVEMTACDWARQALEVTTRALADGRVSPAEAEEMVAAQRAVIEANDLSLAYNVRQQPRLDGFIARMAAVPAAVVALVTRELGTPEAA
jgi:hypothetical protein